MDSAIREKLALELGQRIVSERQVVYILVELRKLLEKADAPKQYAALRFCSDWAVHSKLNRASAQKMVPLFDK